MENHMRKTSLAKRISKSKSLYVMILPCMIFTFIFSYYPLTGWIMAFENFKPAKGYWGSKFVGLDQFRFLFDDFEFWRAYRLQADHTDRILPASLPELGNRLRPGAGHAGLRRNRQQCQPGASNNG